MSLFAHNNYRPHGRNYEVTRTCVVTLVLWPNTLSNEDKQYPHFYLAPHKRRKKKPWTKSSKWKTTISRALSARWRQQVALWIASREPSLQEDMFITKAHKKEQRNTYSITPAPSHLWRWFSGVPEQATNLGLGRLDFLGSRRSSHGFKTFPQKPSDVWSNWVWFPWGF